MTTRRNLITGGLCLAAAGAAYGLKPRRRLNLLGGRSFEAIIPAEFAGWSGESMGDLVQPLPGSLAERLYTQQVSRLYHNETLGADVMMLVAYGDNQSDLLQLHRPESCYPAVGFHIALSQQSNVPLTSGVALPGRRVIAERGQRREDIIYWTRLGEYLPVTAGDQRVVRLRTAMQGYVADGALFRFSVLSLDDGAAFKVLESFIADLILAVPAQNRAPLIGPRLARLLKTAQSA